MPLKGYTVARSVKIIEKYLPNTICYQKAQDAQMTPSRKVNTAAAAAAAPVKTKPLKEGSHHDHHLQLFAFYLEQNDRSFLPAA